MTDQLSPLSYDYVFNHVFKKLCDTFDKYRDLIPAVEDVESAITSKDNHDPFKITMDVIEMLKLHAEKSDLVQEVFENVRQDFWHGVSPEEVKKHPGKYYIDSIAD
ncbi:MAG: hypothetical protein ACOYXT_04135 [Bacteroidota bacterium]